MKTPTNPPAWKAAHSPSCFASSSGLCDLTVIHESKEVENFLLVPGAIDRAAATRLADRAKRIGTTTVYEPLARSVLQAFAEEKRHYVTSQYLALRRRFERGSGGAMVEETLTQSELADIERRWSDADERFRMIPGKDAMSCLNHALQERFGVNVTPTAVIDAMHVGEVPSEMATLISKLDDFIRGAVS